MIKTILLQRHSLIPLHVWPAIIFAIPMYFCIHLSNNTILMASFFIVCLLYICNELLRNLFFLKKGFVSHIQISEGKLLILYSYLFKKETKIIPFNEIKEFKITIKSKMGYNIGRQYMYYQRLNNVAISIKTEIINLNIPVYSNINDNLDCIFRLLDISNRIPNFSYEVEGDDFFKKTIQQYAESVM